MYWFLYDRDHRHERVNLKHLNFELEIDFVKPSVGTKYENNSGFFLFELNQIKWTLSTLLGFTQ